MRNSLRLRLTIIFISLATVPLLVVSLLVAQRNFSVLSQEAIFLQSEIAQRVGKDVTNLIESRENELSLLIGTRSIILLDKDDQVNIISGLLANQENYEEVALLDANGKEIVRVGSLKVFTDDELIFRTTMPEYVEPKVTGEIYYSPVQFNQLTGEPFMIIALPSFDVRSGEFNGVLTANFRFRSIWDLMSATRLPGNGIVYVVDAENRVVAHRDPSIVLGGTEIELPNEDGFFPGLENEDAALASVSDTFGAQTFRTVAEQEQSEALALGISNFVLAMVALFIALIVAIILSVLAARQIVGPIENMAVTTQAIAAGDLTQEIKVERKDEIGKLASAFNLMTIQLRNLIGGLEELITSRTRDLTLAAEVGNAVSHIRNLDELLATAVELIRSRFDLYYTQIYLLDFNEENLILRAGTGSVGEELQRQGHLLPLNVGSLNGTAVINREPVIVANTEKNISFQPNPLLPDTRSEMAIPLIVGDYVVGVLDLQSTEAGALSEENLQAFEILAGLLANAIVNARLIQDSNQARAELESRIRQSALHDWDQYLDAIHRQERMGYRFENEQIVEISKSEMLEGNDNLSLPITVAGETIGTIDLEATENDSWSEEDLELVQAIAHQVGQQLDNLRLLSESERYRQEAEEATHRLIREGWANFEVQHEELSFSYDQSEVISINPEDLEKNADLSVSLSVQNEPIGKMELAGIQPGDNQEASSFLTAVANRLSTHIENIRLSEQTELALAEARQRTEELNILNQMGAAFTTATSADEILNHIYQYTSQFMNTSKLSVTFYDEGKDEVEIRQFYDPETGISDGTIKSITRRQHGNGLNEYVIRTRQSLFIQEDLEKLAASFGLDLGNRPVKTWMGVPMSIGNRILGVISVQSFDSSEEFNDHHLELLTAVASSAAISIESLRLLQQVQSRARQEQILREVTARVHAAVDAESILRTAAKEINRSLGLETFVYLDSKEKSESVKVNGSNGRDDNN